jgi:hypothetical protein
VNGNFITLDSANGTHLFIFTEKKGWREATPGNYWYERGKVMGVNMNNGEFNNLQNKTILTKHYSQGGILSTSEQVRTDAKEGERKPANAARLATETKSNNMSLYFHYVAEPGRFPKGIDVSNIDRWLNERFQGIIQLIKSNQTDGNPMRISFNEAWVRNEWNPESNPIRDKYGEKWIEEYTYRLLNNFIEAGLIPNKDFVIVFNDTNLFALQEKQNTVFNTLNTARINAYNRLIQNPAIKEKLASWGITKPDNIDIALGVQIHTKLGQNIDDNIFIPDPTEQQIEALADKFGSLGGVILTEVNPYGTSQQKLDFMKIIANALEKTPNLKGVIFWNIFKDTDDGLPQNTFGQQILEFFNPDGSPTKMFYALLTSP